MNKPKWSVAQAEVNAVDAFQNDDGETMAYVKLTYWGGSQTIMVDPTSVDQFKPHLGKMVSVECDCLIEIKKGSGLTKITMSNPVVKGLSK